VSIAVSDTGSGIDREHLPHVFERFYRADPSRDRATGGAGLGLAIVKRLVEAHGGTIRAESDGPGRGATFRIELPA
jgi:signal transduction histidine kinase